jgi:hypothetical protein
MPCVYEKEIGVRFWHWEIIPSIWRLGMVMFELSDFQKLHLSASRVTMMHSRPV